MQNHYENDDNGSRRTGSDGGMLALMTKAGNDVVLYLFFKKSQHSPSSSDWI